MRSLFLYNWEVRDAYFRVFEALSIEELTKDRKAGLGTILKTFFHIIDVEYSWMCAVSGKPEAMLNAADYKDLPSLVSLSNQLRSEIRENLDALQLDRIEHEDVTPEWMTRSFNKAEIVKHVIVHEVHHVGQLSIWARELGIEPANVSFIGRGFINKANTNVMQ